MSFCNYFSFNSRWCPALSIRGSLKRRRTLVRLRQWNLREARHQSRGFPRRRCRGRPPPRCPCSPPPCTASSPCPSTQCPRPRIRVRMPTSRRKCSAAVLTCPRRKMLTWRNWKSLQRCSSRSGSSWATPRGTWAWPWGNCMVMTSLRQQSQDLRLWTSHSRTCANSSPS